LTIEHAFATLPEHMFAHRRKLVLSAAALAAAGALAAGFSPAASPAAGPAPDPAPQRYVVQPGDTLWGIAGEAYPDEDPRAAVDQIYSANDLSGASLMPGEVLVLP
jgi:nucleoid-associated protein YgaU